MSGQDVCEEKIRNEVFDEVLSWQTFEVKLLQNSRGVKEEKLGEKLSDPLDKFEPKLVEVQEEHKKFLKTITRGEITEKIQSSQLEVLQVLRNRSTTSKINSRDEA